MTRTSNVGLKCKWHPFLCNFIHNRFFYSYGKNIKPLPTLPPFYESVRNELGNKIWWGLAGASILSALCGWIAVGVGALTEGISILIAGIFMILITSGADYVKDRNFVTL